MDRPRNLNRNLNRSSPRHATRMLGGAQRPTPPNYLGQACAALREAIRIRKGFESFFKEQRRQLADYQWRQEIKTAIARVYGPGPNATPDSVKKR